MDRKKTCWVEVYIIVVVVVVEKYVAKTLNEKVETEGSAHFKFQSARGFMCPTLNSVHHRGPFILEEFLIQHQVKKLLGSQGDLAIMQPHRACRSSVTSRHASVTLVIRTTY